MLGNSGVAVSPIVRRDGDATGGSNDDRHQHYVEDDERDEREADERRHQRMQHFRPTVTRRQTKPTQVGRRRLR